MRLLLFFGSTALVTVIMLLVYGTVQQTYRTGVDDPQVQMARTLASQLEAQQPLNDFRFNEPIDISRSMLPFVVLYDASGNALRSTGSLNGKLPQVPVSVFESLKDKTEHRFTWQPRAGVRMAMVIVKTNVGDVRFIAAARSMQETEERIEKMRFMVFIAWIISMVIIAIIALLGHYLHTRKLKSIN